VRTTGALWKQRGLEWPHPCHCNFGGHFFGRRRKIEDQASPSRAIGIQYKKAAVASKVKAIRKMRKTPKLLD